MKTIIAFILFMLFLSVVYTESELNYRYLITAPKTMYINTTQKVCTTFENATNKELIIYLNTFDSIITFNKEYLAGESGCLDLILPDSLPASAADLTIHIKDVDSGVTEVDKTVEITLSSKTLFTLIQTDKPIYKPGQKVRFRILTMNSVLQPVLDLETKVWIEDPNKIKVAQWRNIDCPSGLCSLEMPLSEEPVLGKWTIYTKHGTLFKEMQTFEVQEYVLPKFEITINPPAFILPDFDYIETEICARYTYGKPVKGSLFVKISVEKIYSAPISFTERGKIDGCKIVKTKGSYLGLDSSKVMGFSPTLKVFAEVKEAETDIKINLTHPGVEISRVPLNFELLDYSKSYFKPGIPYYGTLLVKRPDGTPAPNEKIEVLIRHGSRDKFVKTFTSNSIGLITFTVPALSPSVASFTINIKALDHPDKPYPDEPENYWKHWMLQPQTAHQVKQWYSPSQSFAQIRPIADILDCNRKYPITIYYTTEDQTANIELYYQVMSRGAVILFNKTIHAFDLEKSGVRVDESFLSSVKEDVYSFSSEEAVEEAIPPFVDSITLDLTLTPDMSPKSHLLVYFIIRLKNSSEVVADSQDFKINQCLKNEVKLNFNKTKILPGDKARLELQASANSLCALSVIDKSVHILRSSNQLTKKRVFDRLLEFYPVKETYSKSKCDYSSFHPDMPMFRRRRLILTVGTDYVDSLESFRDMSIITISNIELEKRPCNTPFLNTRGRYDTFPPGFPGLAETIYDETVDHGFASPIMLENAAPAMQGKAGPPTPLSSPKAESLVELRNFFPETWLWELQSVDDFGKKMIDREVPHTITTWIGSMFCIHPSAGLGVSSIATLNAFQPFFISYNLPYSVIRGETVPLVVSVFNYLPECITVKLTLEKTDDFTLNNKDTKKLCLCDSESKVHRFVIQPKTLGIINITVHARTIDDKSICGNDVVMSSESKAKDSITQQLLIEAEGFPKEYTQSNLVCPAESPDGIFKQTISLTLPDDVVNSSARAKINIIGDIMGPTLTGLDKLVQLPTGCGEQNMATLAPLVAVMKYLDTTNQIIPDLKAKAVDFLKSGYQRQSNYRHSDGSYSAFGKSDKQGSLWLTSFVVKSFSQARSMIEIDETNLERSVQFLKLQQMENGCFLNTGRVLSKEMKGGLGDDNSIMLSAYVLISLLESNVSTSDNSIQMGLSCIMSEDIQDIYGLTLITYALTLAGEHEKASTLLSKLEGLAKKSENLMYWEKDENPNKGLSIEITAYNLLTYANTISFNPESMIKALAIVRWLSQQRNPYGGFQSTQDTVVALQALAVYASKTFDETVDMNLSVKGIGLDHNFQITSVNRLVLQTHSVPVVPNTLEIIAQGKGCALIQASLLYNIDGGKLKDFEPFSIVASAKEVKSGYDACKKRKMKICAKYMLPDGASNMAIIEVKMVTGYWPDKDSLKLLISENRDIKRFEIDNKVINFYFDEITNQQTCINFIIEQHLEIKDAKAGTVRIYDYYDQGKSKSVTYTVSRHSPGCLKADAKPNLTLEDLKSTKTPLSMNESDNSIQETEFNSTPTKMTLQTLTKRSAEDNNDGEQSVMHQRVLADGSIGFVGEPEYITLPTFDTSNLKKPDDPKSDDRIEEPVNVDPEDAPTEETDIEDLDVPPVVGGGSVGDPEYYTLPTFDMKAHLKQKRSTAFVGDPEYYTLPTFDMEAHLKQKKSTAFVGDPEYFTLPTFDMEAHLHSQKKSTDSNENTEYSTLPSVQMDDPGKTDFEDIDTVAKAGDPEYFTLPTFDPKIACPVCVNQIPENIAKIYCSAAFAFQADVQNSTSVKLHKVLKPDIKHNKPLIKIQLDDFCTCDLQMYGKKGKVLIFGNPKTLVEKDFVSKHEFHLSKNNYVIPQPSQKYLNTLSASC